MWIPAGLNRRESQQQMNDCGIHTLVKIASFILRHHLGVLCEVYGGKKTDVEVELDKQIITDHFCEDSRYFVQQVVEIGRVSLNDDVVRSFKIVIINIPH
eukprot:scaffold8828_cov204-Amphora_coffeaeformis.AAC.9